jgi:octaprenyl-diphosphate synthase
MQVGTEQQRSLLRAAIEEGGRERIDSVVEVIAATDAIGYTAQLAESHARLAKDALASLPSGPATDALAALADFSISRTH